MSEGRHLLLVLAASELAKRPNGEAWVHQVLASQFEELPEDSVVLTAGAPGPDTWACEAAEGYGLRWVVYLRDGRRLDSTDEGATERRWARQAIDARAHGEALLDAARKSKQAGWEVHVLALGVPGQSLGDVDGVLSMAQKAGFSPQRADLEE